MNRRITTIFIVALVLLAGVILIAKSVMRASRVAPQATMQASMSPTTTDQMSSSSASESATSSSTLGAASTVKEFTVTGSNYAFSPSTLTVDKGDTVKITFVNSGGIHDFVIDAFNAKTQRIQSGQQTTVQFFADKTGTFDYYCSVANHRAMGMQGTLTVQ